eukprot:gene22080-biopygen20706
MREVGMRGGGAGPTWHLKLWELRTDPRRHPQSQGTRAQASLSPLAGGSPFGDDRWSAHHCRSAPPPRSCVRLRCAVKRVGRQRRRALLPPPPPGGTGHWRGRGAGMARAWRGLWANSGLGWRGRSAGMARAWRGHVLFPLPPPPIRPLASPGQLQQGPAPGTPKPRFGTIPGATLGITWEARECVPELVPSALGCCETLHWLHRLAPLGTVWTRASASVFDKMRSGNLTAQAGLGSLPVYCLEGM